MNKKKKILVDVRCIGGEGQGMLTYIVGLYNAMYRHFGVHYEFLFAGYDYDAIKLNFPWIEESQFIPLHTQSRWSLFTSVFPKIIESYNIDYAHFQYVTPFIKKCKHIVTTHDVLFLDFPEEFSLMYRVKRKLLFFLSLVRSEIKLTVSNYSRHKIASHFRLDSNKIAITTNAVNNKFGMPYNKEDAKERMSQKFGIQKYILYVSRIEKRKNHTALLDAFKTLDLAEKGYQLVFVGNNTLKEDDLSKRIIEIQSQYPNKVHWLKNLSDEDLLQIYRAADLFVYPSKAEGFGIPPIEAAALGINTICASNTAMKDFSFLKENLYEDSSSESLHQLITKNLTNPPPPGHLRSISNFVKKKYSWLSAAQVLHAEITNN